MGPNPAPLTDQHLTLINNALRNITDARALMERAERVGMDVSGHRQAADQMEQALTAYKTEFFGLKQPKG